MNVITTLPPWLVAFLVPLMLLCIGCLVWSILPRRSQRLHTDIEQQIKTLRQHADREVSHRPRVRGNGCATPPAAHLKAPPVTHQPKACSGGLCRHQADCSDHHCPGRLAAMLATLP